MSKNPFRYFNTSPKVIQLGVLIHVRFPPSLRNIEGLLHERGIDACHESVRIWGDRHGTHFVNKICKRGTEAMNRVNQWHRRVDEVFVKIRAETHYPWRAVNHEGEAQEACLSRSGTRLGR